MKKNAIIAVALTIVLLLQASCLAQNAKDDATESPNETSPAPTSFVTPKPESTTTEPPDETPPDQTPSVAQGQEIDPSGLSDIELVELFILFLQDEIPILDYYEDKEEVRYSDLTGSCYPDGTGWFDGFYLVDMDGDGDIEFWCNVLGGVDIIKYDSNNRCFRRWFSGSYHYEPIGTGQMFSLYAGTETSYQYEVYDKNANFVEGIAFTREHDYYDLEADIDYCKFYIYKYYASDDGKFVYDDCRLVTESEWEEEIAFLLELRDNGPERLSYQDLLDMVK